MDETFAGSREVLLDRCEIHFATGTLAKLREDTQWLTKASEAITKHWRAKNKRDAMAG